MLVDYKISEIYNSRIREVILIGCSTTLLDHKHQLIQVCMQQMIAHGFGFRVIVIYIGY